MKTLGAVKPLSIPPMACTYISMDFMVGFPKSGNK
jgi:hypothetical protein